MYRRDGWQSADSILGLLSYLPPDRPERKLRLFGLACCKRVAHLMTDREAIDALERIQECIESRTMNVVLEEIRSSSQRLADRADAAVIMGQGKSELGEDGHIHFANCSPYAMANPRPAQAALDVSSRVRWALDYIGIDRDQEMKEHCGIFRDILGNPFRPVALDPRWLTSTVLDLANLIYSERQFERMPLLGDALMDAGCDNDEVIKHCHGPGPHVLGCWVVDLLLRKS